MGQLTDALKAYKEEHKHLGLSDAEDAQREIDNLKLTPLHAHAMALVLHGENNGNRLDPGASTSSVVSGLQQAAKINKAKAISTVSDLGLTGMIIGRNQHGTTGDPEGLYSHPDFGTGKKLTPDPVGHLACDKHIITGKGEDALRKYLNP